MQYEQAEAEFRRLEGMRRAGQIGDDAYRAHLNALRVTDEYGRPWMLQEQTGQWFVFHAGQWVASTPPGRLPQAVPQAIPAPVASRRPAAGRRATPSTTPRPAAARRLGCVGATWRILLWDIVWVLVALLLWQQLGPRMVLAYVGVGILALVTLIFWVRFMTPRRPRTS
ncbi:MAG: hypothetical protein ACYC5M_08535 [Anaerolineae bacterium]